MKTIYIIICMIIAALMSVRAEAQNNILSVGHSTMTVRKNVVDGKDNDELMIVHEKREDKNAFFEFTRQQELTEWFGVSYSASFHSNGHGFIAPAIALHRKGVWVTLAPIYFGTVKFKDWSLGLVDGFTLGVKVNIYEEYQIGAEIGEYNYAANSLSTTPQNFGSVEYVNFGIGFSF